LSKLSLFQIKSPSVLTEELYFVGVARFELTTISAMEFSFSILSDTFDDGEIKQSKAIIKFVSETNLKDGKIAKQLIEEFLNN
jgi:hypothetical protein